MHNWSMAWRKRVRKIDDGDRVVKDEVRSRDRTMNRAVKLLAAKPRSVRELRERLLEKTWTNAPIVDAVIEKLKEYKYLDDEQFARDLAVTKLRQRPQGKRKLEQTMSQKKLDKAVVDDAITEAFENLPEAALIDLSIEKRLRLKGAPKTRDELRKFYDHLLRQGFAYDLIREKIGKIEKIRLDTYEDGA